MNPTRIIIVGAGFGGIYTLKRLHDLFHRNTNIQITLVNEKNYFLFTPLLHEIATGGINPENAIEPIRRILGCCLHALCLGKATKVDPEKKIITTTAGDLSYDYLVLAPGAKTNFYDILGAKDYCFSLKTLDDAISLKNHCIGLIEQASHIKERDERKNMLHFVVVGGGPTGVELAAEMQEFLKGTFSKYYSKDVIDDISITLIQKASELLPQFSKPLRTKSLEILRRKGVNVRLQTSVSQVTQNNIKINEGIIIKTRTVVWVAGVQPVRLTFTGPVEQDKNGKLEVNQYLQLDKHPNIYAIGDIAQVKSNSGNYLPSLAQVAVQEARNVAENIKQQINKQKLKPFVYKSSGSLISLGPWMAIGEISHFFFSGHLTWWIWRTIYLSKLISWQKKIKVAIDWTVNTFSPRDISRL